MKVVIFTFDSAPKERKNNVKLLKQQLENMESVEVEVFTGGDSTCVNFVEMCKKYNGEDIVMIEDDIELSDTFEQDVSDFIENYETSKYKASEKIVNFHWIAVPPRKYTTYKDYKVYELQGIRYGNNQCVYLPKYALETVLNSYQKVFKQYPYYVNINDHASIIARIFKNDTFLVPSFRPVTHLDFKSKYKFV